MNPLTVIWRFIRFRPRLYLLAHLLYFGYTVSVAFSGLILRAFFDQLDATPGALSVWAIVGLQLGNTLLAMIGLGGANYARGFSAVVWHCADYPAAARAGRTVSHGKPHNQ